MQAAGDDIGAPGVDIDRHAAERRRRIDIAERPDLAAQVTQAVERLSHGRRGITVDTADHRGLHPARGLRDRVERHHRAPVGIDGFDDRAKPLGDFGQQEAEPPRPDDQDRGARFDQRDHGRFDAGARRTIDQEGPAVLRAEDLAIQGHGLVHIGRHFRIELAQQVGRHRPQDTRMGIDRPRPHQQSLWRIEFPEIFTHNRLPVGR